jgi:hypothetical protein
LSYQLHTSSIHDAPWFPYLLYRPAIPSISATPFLLLLELVAEVQLPPIVFPTPNAMLAHFHDRAVDLRTVEILDNPLGDLVRQMGYQGEVLRSPSVLITHHHYLAVERYFVLLQQSQRPLIANPARDKPAKLFPANFMRNPPNKNLHTLPSVVLPYPNQQMPPRKSVTGDISEYSPPKPQN